MPHIFDDARLKIERAIEHIINLEIKISVFLNTSPFKLVHRGIESPRKEEIICVKIEKAIPDNFSIIIGDAVHNLRTALDYAVYALIYDKVPEKDIKSIQFPFCKEEIDFENELKNKPIRLAGDKMLGVIRSLKPYAKGNGTLYGIHQLDIGDKHRFLIPLANTPSLTADGWGLVHPALSILKGEGVLALMSNGGFHIAHKFPNRKTKLSYWSSFKAFEKYTEVQPVFTIAFDSEKYFSRKDVISDLYSLVHEVESVIKVMESAL